MQRSIHWGAKWQPLKCKAEPWKTVYLYSLSVYLCSFECFYRLKLLIFEECFKYIFTFCFLRFHVFQLPCGINKWQGHGTYIFNLLIFLTQIGHERYDDNNFCFWEDVFSFWGRNGVSLLPISGKRDDKKHFVKPNEQSQACLSYAMARNGRIYSKACLRITA